MEIAIHWFRRDLRTADNVAFGRALREQKVVWPVFIFDPRILQSPDVGAPRIQFLLDSLACLHRTLGAHDSRLVIRQGEVEEEMIRLIQETGATTVYWNRDYEPYARERDRGMENRLRAQGVQVVTCKDGVILEPGEVLKSDGTPYTVYSPFAKQWQARVGRVAESPVRITPLPGTGPISQELPTATKLGFTLNAQIIPGGEEVARSRLQAFMRGPVLQYQKQRNFPAIPGTSRLSADLRFGTLSPRQIYREAQIRQSTFPEAREQVEVFVRELIWREFYRSILWHYPHVAERCFKSACDHLPWENNQRLFKAWCEGRTGFPLIDAAMRQLEQTGWMHNRLRMIVASFLTKDLLVDYRWGERYFMQKLIDGDLASNNGGWQWSASTGTDAQPYFRIFNPSAQAERFDPEGKFIETYVPEVNSLHYPPPIVDHSIQRLKSLRMFEQSR